MQRKLFFSILFASSLASQAQAAFFNSNDAQVYAAFAQGATVQDFESPGSLVPYVLSDLNDGLNGSTTIPSNAQVGGQFSGLHFHSGGGSFNDPVNSPGTPAALLSLDAKLGQNVIGSLEINTETLALDSFVEVVFTLALQNRIGFWLNPALGQVRLSAFDSNQNQLESGIGDAGNFVGISHTANEIKYISIVSQNLGKGFTLDTLTYGRSGGGNTVPEPSTLC